MKKPLFLILILAINISSFAQTTIEDVAGFYEVTYDATNGLIVDKLTLNADGTFVFHEYDRHDKGIPPERNKYAKGTWKLDKNLISFQTVESDFDEKFTLDFKNSLARFDIKLIKAKYGEENRSSLRFYQSGISWLKRRTLIKIK